MTTPLRAVLFDKDGTLIDFHRTWGPATGVGLRASAADGAALAAAAVAIGFDLATDSFRPDSAFIAESNDVILALLEPHLDLQAFGEACMVAARETTEAAAGLPQLLDALRSRDIALGIATNDWVEIADDQLQVLGWADRFDVVVGSDSGFGAKPEPGMLLGALARLGVAPEAALMVGDTAHDLHSGRAAGIETVLVTNGHATGEVAPDVAALADIVVESLVDLEAELLTRGRLP